MQHTATVAGRSDASGSSGGGEMGRLLASFAEADTSGSGVAAAAMQTLVRRMGLSATEEMGLMRLVGEVEPDGRGRVTYDALVACLVRHGWQPEIQRRPSQRFATESVSRADFKPYALPVRVPGVSPEVKTTLPTSTLEMSPDRRRHSTTSQTSDSYRPWPLPPPLPESPYAVGAPSAIETTPSTCESPERLRNSFAAIHEGGPYRPWPIEPPSPGATSDSPYAVMEMPVAGSPSKLIHAEQQGLTIRQPQFEGLSITHSSYTAQPLPMRVAAPPRTDRATSPTPGMDADAGARFPTLRRSTTMDHFQPVQLPEGVGGLLPAIGLLFRGGTRGADFEPLIPARSLPPAEGVGRFTTFVDEQGVMAFHLAAERPGSGERLPLGTLELSTEQRGEKEVELRLTVDERRVLTATATIVVFGGLLPGNRSSMIVNGDGVLGRAPKMPAAGKASTVLK